MIIVFYVVNKIGTFIIVMRKKNHYKYESKTEISLMKKKKQKQYNWFL